jgi:hypothetical protein
MEIVMNTPVAKKGMFAKAAATAPSEEVPPLRPAMREEDPKERAAKRAAQLRSHANGDIVDGSDDFYVPLDIIPDGWTYEWKRHTTYGAEDPAYQVQLARSGWSAVPVSRHPEMMPHNTEHQVITRKGMILMECPTEIVQERVDAEKRKARMQVMHKEQQLAGTPDGTMTRDHAKARPQISKSYEAMPIPKD